MRNFFKRLKSSKVLVIGMVVVLCFAFTGCSKKGEDRCDDATRNYLRGNIDKAKAGDPSGFEECIRVNYLE